MSQYRTYRSYKATFLLSSLHTRHDPANGSIETVILTNVNFKLEKKKLTRLPIVHAAGHNPGASGRPGILTETSIYPVVKQNLFHDWSIPLLKLRLWLFISSMVITSFPFSVVMAYNSTK